MPGEKLNARTPVGAPGTRPLVPPELVLVLGPLVPVAPLLAAEALLPLEVAPLVEVATVVALRLPLEEVAPVVVPTLLLELAALTVEPLVAPQARTTAAQATAPASRWQRREVIIVKA